MDHEVFYKCPACGEGIVECVCWDDHDEWECSNCTFKVHRGSDLLKMIPDLQEAEEEIKNLKTIIQEVPNWIICAVISSPEDMMRNAVRIEKITSSPTFRSDCHNPNVPNKLKRS